MPHPQLNRSRLRIRRLKACSDMAKIERNGVSPEAEPRPNSSAAAAALTECFAKNSSFYLPLPLADAGRGFFSILAMKYIVEPLYYAKIKTAKPIIL